MANINTDILPSTPEVGGDSTGNPSGTPTETKTTGELLQDIVTNVGTVRTNMKDGGLNVADNSKLADLANESENLPTYVTKIRTKLKAMGLADDNTTLAGLADAMENQVAVHECEPVEIKQGESFTITPGYHTGNINIYAIDDPDADEENLYKVGETTVEAPLPGGSALLVTKDNIPDDGTGVPFYALGSVNVSAPDLSKHGFTNDNNATTYDVVKGMKFINKSGVQTGALEKMWYSTEIEPTDTGDRQISAPVGTVLTGFTVKAIDKTKYAKLADATTPASGAQVLSGYQYATSDGWKDGSMANHGAVTGKINVGEMDSSKEFALDAPGYVESINITVNNDIYDTLKMI